MKELENEQWVVDKNGRVNNGLPVQIVNLKNGLVEVFYLNGEQHTETFLWINKENLN